MKENPFRKFINSFTQSTRTPTARPPPGAPSVQYVNSNSPVGNKFTATEIDEAFENQYWENNFGARPKSTNTFSAKPDDLSHLGAVALPTTTYSDRPFTEQKPAADERRILDPETHVSFLLTEIANLRDEDSNPGREHSRTTTFSHDPTIPNFEERPFPLEHGNKPFSIVPLDELVDELKFLRLINGRPDAPDDLLETEIIYLIQALPRVDTPNKLFQFLKLRTYLSHIEAPTANEPVAATPPIFPVEPQLNPTERLEDYHRRDHVVDIDDDQPAGITPNFHDSPPYQPNTNTGHYTDDTNDTSEISPIQSHDSGKENLQFTYITSTPSQNTGLVRLRQQQLAAHVQAKNHPTQLINLFNQPVRQTTPPTPVASTTTVPTTTSRPISSSFVPTPTTTKPQPPARKAVSFAPTIPTSTPTMYGPYGNYNAQNNTQTQTQGGSHSNQLGLQTNQGSFNTVPTGHNTSQSNFRTSQGNLTTNLAPTTTSGGSSAGQPTSNADYFSKLFTESYINFLNDGLTHADAKSCAAAHVDHHKQQLQASQARAPPPPVSFQKPIQAPRFIPPNPQPRFPSPYQQNFHTSGNQFSLPSQLPTQAPQTQSTPFQPQATQFSLPSQVPTPTQFPTQAIGTPFSFPSQIPTPIPQAQAVGTPFSFPSQIPTPASQTQCTQFQTQSTGNPFPFPTQFSTQPSQAQFTPFPTQATTHTVSSTLDQSAKEQKIAITLIATVPSFSGKGTTRFETWIKHFDTQLDTADFDEEKKVRLLLSKLTNDALECALGFRERNPISAKSYENMKNCLFQRFHGNETRVQYVTEFQNCTRLAGESLRDFACRLQKLFAHAYPMMKGMPTGPEVLLMDKFICGLPRKLQNDLKHKEYPSFEALIKKAEARLACYDDQFDDTIANINAVSAYQTQPIIHSVQPSPNDAGHKGVIDAVSQLCSIVQQNMSIQTEELQKMRKQGSHQQVKFSDQNKSRPQQEYCAFHGCWTNHHTGNCWTRERQQNYTCDICNERGHNHMYCPSQRRNNSRPNSPTQRRSNSRPNSPTHRGNSRPNSPSQRRSYRPPSPPRDRPAPTSQGNLQGPEN